MRFSTKMATLLLVALITVGVGISLFVFTANVETLQERIIARLEERSFDTLDLIDRNLRDRSSDIQIIASDPIISSPNATPEQITSRLVDFRNQYKTYVSLSFFDLNRTRIADTAGLRIGKQHPLQTYWENPALGEDIVLEIGESISLKMPVIHFVYPVRDQQGAVFGVVVSRMPLAKLHYMVRGLAKMEGIKIDLIGKEGLLLYSNYNRKGILQDKVDIEEHDREFALEKNQKTAAKIHTQVGEQVISFHSREQGYLDFPSQGWVLSAHIPTRIAFAPAIALRNKLIFVLWPAIILIAVAGVLLTRRFTKPIGALIRGTEIIGKGNLEHRIDIESRDEIGELAVAFNQMAEDLKRVTASRDDLNKEVAERKQAEEALRKAHDELEQRVKERTVELVEANEQLNREIEERKQAEEALQQRTYDLDERVKELNCLYGISNLVEKPGISLDEI